MATSDRKKAPAREDGYENPRTWRIEAKLQMKHRRFRAVWSALVDRTANNAPTVCESWDQVADLAGVSRRWVKMVVREMIEAGYIVPIGDSKGGRGNSRKLRLRLPEYVEKGELQCPKGGTPVSERGKWGSPSRDPGIPGEVDVAGGDDCNQTDSPYGAGLGADIDAYLRTIAARAVAEAVNRAASPQAEKLGGRYGCIDLD